MLLAVLFSPWIVYAVCSLLSDLMAHCLNACILILARDLPASVCSPGNLPPTHPLPSHSKSPLGPIVTTFATAVGPGLPSITTDFRTVTVTVPSSAISIASLSTVSSPNSLPNSPFARRRRIADDIACQGSSIVSKFTTHPTTATAATSSLSSSTITVPSASAPSVTSSLTNSVPLVLTDPVSLSESGSPTSDTSPEPSTDESGVVPGSGTGITATVSTPLNLVLTGVTAVFLFGIY
jgi:hypothetical protein